MDWDVGDITLRSMSKLNIFCLKERSSSSSNMARDLDLSGPQGKGLPPILASDWLTDIKDMQSRCLFDSYK
jgi:hypothetical protein